MADSSGRLGRLLKMALLLSERHQATASEIARIMDIAERTVYRDMKTLAECMPITSVPGVRGGYRLAEDFQLDPMVFATEQPALLTKSSDGFSALLMGIDDERNQALLSKAISKLPREVRSIASRAHARIFVDSGDWYWTNEETPNLHLLKSAVMAAHEIVAGVILRNGARLPRQPFWPLGLVWKAGTWYAVLRRPRSEETFRVRLTRLVELEATTTPFVHPRTFNLRHWWVEDIHDFGTGGNKVVMRIFPPAYDEFRSFNWKSESQVVRKESHWEATLMVDNDSWLIPIALSFAPDIEVVQPESLRDTIRDRLNRATTLYAGQLTPGGQTAPVSSDERMRASTRPTRHSEERSE